MNEASFETLVGNLNGLYAVSGPGEIRSSGRMDDWNVFGPGMLARCSYLLESISALSKREIDAAILAGRGSPGI